MNEAACWCCLVTGAACIRRGGGGRSDRVRAQTAPGLSLRDVLGALPHPGRVGTVEVNHFSPDAYMVLSRV
jgi:hypothetical protein